MLIEAMRNFNSQLLSDISKSQQQFTELIHFQPDEETIQSALVEIFNKCLKVDGGPVQIELKARQEQVL